MARGVTTGVFVGRDELHCIAAGPDLPRRGLGRMRETGASPIDEARRYVDAVPSLCREGPLPSRPAPSQGSLRLQQRSSSLDVTLRNISRTGANIAGDTLICLPPAFEFQVLDGYGGYSARQARLVWSRGRRRASSSPTDGTRRPAALYRPHARLRPGGPGRARVGRSNRRAASFGRRD